MFDNQETNIQDPKLILQTAIEAIELFTHSEVSSLRLSQDGRLVAAKESLLANIVSLAKSYIAPLFSEQLRKDRQKRIFELKKVILRAREFIQSHSDLIEKYQLGDLSQRTLAQTALTAIERYNMIVAQETSKAMPRTYNYERERLLRDKEIKGQKIEMPIAYLKSSSSINGQDSPLCLDSQMLREFSHVLHSDAGKKRDLSSSPAYEKTVQVMIDTFHMEAIWMIEKNLQRPLAEIVPLIKQTTPEIDESDRGSIVMRQLIEVKPGLLVLLEGYFNRNHSQYVMVPILHSLKGFLITQLCGEVDSSQKLKAWYRNKGPLDNASEKMC